MNPMWLMRMAQWVRNPPSAGRVKLFLAVIGLCLLLYGIERMFGWPDWLTLERVRPPSRVSQ